VWNWSLRLDGCHCGRRKMKNCIFSRLGNQPIKSWKKLNNNLCLKQGVNDPKNEKYLEEKITKREI